MKQIFTYILLVSLLVRPLFIAGHIAYYELNIEYITEKFCENKAKPELQCNGKCHLAKELSVVDTNTSNNQGETVKIVNAIKSFTPLFHQNSTDLSSFSKETYFVLKQVSNLYVNTYSFQKEYSILRPPIV